MTTTDKWEKVRDDDGQVYWWNTRTNESRWTEPTSDESVGSPRAAPPPPPKRNGGASPATTSGAKLSNIVSAGHTMVKTNSMRFRNMMSKDGKETKAAPPAETAPKETRRKKSFQAAINTLQAVKTNLSSNLPDPSTIDGHLVLQAKETNRDIKEVIDRVEISRPYDVEKKMQVSFDENNIRFLGLPEGWAEEAYKQFGISLQTCQRTEVEGYSERIPIVLVKLKARFLELDGVETEGIFRLAPDGQDVADAKLSINTGNALKSLERTKDPHVVANLIKQFFRELRPKILTSLPKDEIMELAGETDLSVIGRDIMQLPDPQRSAFFWLLDLLSEVAAHHEINKMTPTNLAIVLSPNLYDADTNMDPFEELVMSQKVAAFTANCLKWRIEWRNQQ